MILFVYFAPMELTILYLCLYLRASLWVLSFIPVGDICILLLQRFSSSSLILSHRASLWFLWYIPVGDYPLFILPLSQGVTLNSNIYSFKGKSSFIKSYRQRDYISSGKVTLRSIQISLSGNLFYHQLRNLSGVTSYIFKLDNYQNK